ncbi:hypothetical protein BDF14DRAFT_1813513 [Spinellus fusiger]|nr:hypothetical protein BDF14DRAFT_1813513 [Spinellus fusiger]
MSSITQDEAAIYDRQIRLWGLDAQERIRKAHILIAGVRALSSEVVKNLALAGVGSITLLDHCSVEESDLGAQFFLSEADVGMNRAAATAPGVKALNPRVDVVVDKDSIASKDDSYFEFFDIVCVLGAEYSVLSRINNVRRDVGKPFYAADTFGWIGYFFCDLTQHTFVEEKKILPHGKSTQEPTIVRTTCVENYVSLEESLKKDWSGMTPKALKKRVSPVAFMIHILFHFQRQHNRSPQPEDLDDILKQKPEYLLAMGIKEESVLEDVYLTDLATLLATEMAPVAAIVGGVLAQEMIKVLSAKELPVQNWFYYNGRDGSGLVHQL